MSDPESRSPSKSPSLTRSRSASQSRSPSPKLYRSSSSPIRAAATSPQNVSPQPNLSQSVSSPIRAAASSHNPSAAASLASSPNTVQGSPISLSESPSPAGSSKQAVSSGNKEDTKCQEYHKTLTEQAYKYFCLAKYYHTENELEGSLINFLLALNNLYNVKSYLW